MSAEALVPPAGIWEERRDQYRACIHQCGKCRFTPRYVLVAAGVGTPKVVDDMADAVGEAGGDGAEVRTSLDRVAFDRRHTLTLRGPSEAFPEVSAVITPKTVTTASHRTVGRDRQGGEDDSTTWYVTNEPLPRMQPDDAFGRETYERLARIEAQWDPANVFHRDPNVLAAT